jgi:hypothetical protein
MESNVTVLARKKDAGIAKQAADAAARSYKEISGRDTSFEIESGLSDEWYVGHIPELSQLMVDLLMYSALEGLNLLTGHGAFRSTTL